MKVPLSVIVIAHNEEDMIVDCLSSVQWADDIVVVDAYSKDRTVGLSRRFTGKVFQKKWEGYVPAKKFGMERAVHEWILWLDADERVPEDLAREIEYLVKNDAAGSHAGYEVARKAFFLGKWIRHCGWYPGYVLRLFRKEKVRFTESRVHERLECGGKVGRLEHDLLHHTDENLYHYFFKLNRYTSLAAQDLHDAAYRFKLSDILIRPAFIFFKMYFIKRGFLDGIHGFVLSVLSAAYVFCKYAKAWEEGEKRPGAGSG